MKTNLLIHGAVIIIFCILISCSKNEHKSILSDTFPTLTKTTYGGCFNHGGYKSTNDQDTLYYEIVSDTLLLHLTVRKNCAESPSDSVVMDHENVYIFLKAKLPAIANCDCDFEYNYSFTNFRALKLFIVYYKEFHQNEYVRCGSITYP